MDDIDDLDDDMDDNVLIMQELREFNKLRESKMLRETEKLRQTVQTLLDNHADDDTWDDLLQAVDDCFEENVGSFDDCFDRSFNSYKYTMSYQWRIFVETLRVHGHCPQWSTERIQTLYADWGMLADGFTGHAFTKHALVVGLLRLLWEYVLLYPNWARAWQESALTDSLSIIRQTLTHNPSDDDGDNSAVDNKVNAEWFGGLTPLHVRVARAPQAVRGILAETMATWVDDVSGLPFWLVWLARPARQRGGPTIVQTLLDLGLPRVAWEVAIWSQVTHADLPLADLPAALSVTYTCSSLSLLRVMVHSVGHRDAWSVLVQKALASFTEFPVSLWTLATFSPTPMNLDTYLDKLKDPQQQKTPQSQNTPQSNVQLQQLFASLFPALERWLNMSRARPHTILLWWCLVSATPRWYCEELYPLVGGPMSPWDLAVPHTAHEARTMVLAHVTAALHEVLAVDPLPTENTELYALLASMVSLLDHDKSPWWVADRASSRVTLFWHCGLAAMTDALRTWWTRASSSEAAMELDFANTLVTQFYRTLWKVQQRDLSHARAVKDLLMAWSHPTSSARIMDMLAFAPDTLAFLQLVKLAPEDVMTGDSGWPAREWLGLDAPWPAYTDMKRCLSLQDEGKSQELKRKRRAHHAEDEGNAPHHTADPKTTADAAPTTKGVKATKPAAATVVHGGDLPSSEDESFSSEDESFSSEDESSDDSSRRQSNLKRHKPTNADVDVDADTDIIDNVIARSHPRPMTWQLRPTYVSQGPALDVAPTLRHFQPLALPLVDQGVLGSCFSAALFHAITQTTALCRMWQSPAFADSHRFQNVMNRLVHSVDGVVNRQQLYYPLMNAVFQGVPAHDVPTFLWASPADQAAWGPRLQEDLQPHCDAVLQQRREDRRFGMESGNFEKGLWVMFARQLYNMGFRPPTFLISPPAAWTTVQEHVATQLTTWLHQQAADADLKTALGATAAFPFVALVCLAKQDLRNLKANTPERVVCTITDRQFTFTYRCDAAYSSLRSNTGFAMLDSGHAVAFVTAFRTPEDAVFHIGTRPTETFLINSWRMKEGKDHAVQSYPWKNESERLWSQQKKHIGYDTYELDTIRPLFYLETITVTATRVRKPPVTIYNIWDALRPASHAAAAASPDKSGDDEEFTNMPSH